MCLWVRWALYQKSETCSFEIVRRVSSSSPKSGWCFYMEWRTKKRFYSSCFSHCWVASGSQTSLFSSGLKRREQLHLPLAPENSSFGRGKESLSLPTADTIEGISFLFLIYQRSLRNFSFLPPSLETRALGERSITLL